jgi:hypothetical protein
MQAEGFGGIAILAVSIVTAVKVGILLATMGDGQGP